MTKKEILKTANGGGNKFNNKKRKKINNLGRFGNSVIVSIMNRIQEMFFGSLSGIS